MPEELPVTMATLFARRPGGALEEAILFENGMKRETNHRFETED
jgi:hypothetical protein